MIISSGYNIAGPEVEEALIGHPDVLEVAVVGAPHEERGTIVQAFVVLRDPAAGDAAKAAELQDFVKASIAPYKYPRVVEFGTSCRRRSAGRPSATGCGSSRRNGYAPRRRTYRARGAHVTGEKPAPFGIKESFGRTAAVRGYAERRR